MQLGGAIWARGPAQAIDTAPRGGWEFETAHFVAARAGLQLARLRAANAGPAELECAERRYRNALRLLQRIRASLNDSSTAE